MKPAKSATMESASVESASVESASVEAATVESASVEAATVESASAVESASTMRPSVGEIWLAEGDNTQQSGCSGSQSPPYPGLGPVFA